MTMSQAPSAATASAAKTTEGSPPSAATFADEGSSRATTAIRADGSRRRTCVARERISRPTPQTPIDAPSSSENRTDGRDEWGRYLVVIAQRRPSLRQRLEFGLRP